MPGFPVHHHLLEFTQTYVYRSMMPSNHLILCHCLFLPPSIFASIRAFSNESVLRIRWPKYWSFSFSISLSNEYSGLISFRMDWLDLLAVPMDSQKSPPTPEFKSIISLVLSCLYSPTLNFSMTTGKTIALTRQTCVGKVMYLLCNMLLPGILQARTLEWVTISFPNA